MTRDKPITWVLWGNKVLLKYFRVAPWIKRGAGKGCLLGAVIHVQVCLLNRAVP